MICVPLSIGENTFGSVQIINQKNEELFDEKDLDFTENLAREISELLQEKGLLDDYISATHAVEEKNESDLSFQDLFVRGKIKDIEPQLNSMVEYAKLSWREQQEVLKRCQELYKCFNRRIR